MPPVSHRFFKWEVFLVHGEKIPKAAAGMLQYILFPAK